MPPENNCYNEVILNDPTLTVNNPVEGHEIQIIIGSPSKVAKGTLIDFAKKLTEHTRLIRVGAAYTQSWSLGSYEICHRLESRRIPKATSTLGFSNQNLRRNLTGDQDCSEVGHDGS